MKNKLFSLSLIACVITRSLLASEGMESPGESVSVIGIYDSRSIAIAFAGSDIQKKFLDAKMKEREKAREEGDKQKLKELEAWGKSQQKLLHQQGFGTAPVDSILAQISDLLPEIKMQAQADLLVSKWDAETLQKYKAAEKVDVTLLLVEAFKPNEKQRKSALDIRKRDPIQ